MKNFLLSLLLVVLFGEVVTLYLMHSSKNKILGETASPTDSTPSTSLGTGPLTASPSAQPTETPTPEPTPLATPKPTPKPTPTPIPQPKFTSEEINGFIERFASQYSVDPNVLRAIALCESGFNPFAYKAGYAGLFQFGPITWKNLRVKMGEDPNINLRYNAEEAVQTAAYAVSLGERPIWPNCNP